MHCVRRSKVTIQKANADFYAAVIDDKIVVKIGGCPAQPYHFLHCVCCLMIEAGFWAKTAASRQLW